MVIAICRAVLLLTFFAANAFGANYTPWAVPTAVERVSGGLLVAGAFGDVNSCGVGNYIFYPSTYQDYSVVVSMMLAALIAGREVKCYAQDCTAVPMHWGNDVINRSRNGDAIYIR